MILEFLYWKDEAGNKATAEYVITKDVKFTAVFKKFVFISFDSGNYASNPESIKLEENGTVAENELPVLTSNSKQFVFDGWLYSDTNEPVQAPITVTRDITLKANWKQLPPVKYTITATYPSGSTKRKVAANLQII